MTVREIRPGRAWVLEGRTTAFALALADDGVVRQTYVGPRLGPGDDALLAHADPAKAGAVFPVAGGLEFGLPALRLAYADGVRDVRLALVAAVVLDRSRLALTLEDAAYGLRVLLTFRSEAAYDLVVRDARLEIAPGHAGAVVREAAAGALALPPAERYRLTHLAGGWACETQVRRDWPGEGRFEIGSGTRGFTGHAHNPFVALDDGSAGEESGRVLFCALAPRGDWRIVYERAPEGTHRVVAGYGADDFGWRLGPDAPLDLPTIVQGLSLGGFGAMSRALNAYVRARVLPEGRRSCIRPVVYNAWEAAGFAFDDRRLRGLADRAARLGVEVFVVDDGWFGRRVSDRAGLGDWTVNAERFPDGLEALVAHVHGLGMGFGLWVEPEMVNPDADLFRAHPDWVYRFPGRPATEVRHQLALNLARPEVAAFVAGTIQDLVARYGIDYLKWDMNRPLTEVGTTGDRPDPLVDREAPARHTAAVYAILEDLKARHPALWIEACASGGGRADLAMLARADQVWTSDNTFASDRLAIQEGYALAYPALTMDAWVTDNQEAQASLAYRFHSAMTGVLGIGADVSRWSGREVLLARRLVRQYKAIRAIVQHGDAYRLRRPSESAGRESALLYVTPDRGEAVVFAFRLMATGHGVEWPLRLAGLDPDRRYRATELAPVGAGAIRAEASGLALAEIGLALPLRGREASRVVRLRALSGRSRPEGAR